MAVAVAVAVFGLVSFWIPSVECMWCGCVRAVASSAARAAHRRVLACGVRASPRSSASVSCVYMCVHGRDSREEDLEKSVR